MADVDSVLGSISRKFLECPICHGRYRQPKVLNCLHSFCQACLETLHEYSSHGSFTNASIQCPICNQKSEVPKEGVAVLKTNFHLVSLLEEITSQETAAQIGKRKTCGSCEEEKEAVSRCIDCSMDLCLNCQTVPRHIAAVLAQNTVASLEELRCGKIADSKRKQRGVPECPKHAGNKKLFFCETCQELICKDCSVGHERKDTSGTLHPILDLESAASNKRKSTIEALAKLKITLDDHKFVLDSIEGMMKKFDENIDSVREHIREVSNKVRNDVSDEEKHLLFQVSLIGKTQKKKCSQKQTDVESSIEQITNTLEAADSICKTSADCDFLAMYPLIQKAVQSNSSKKPREINLPILKFKERKPSLQIGTLSGTAISKNTGLIFEGPSLAHSASAPSATSTAPLQSSEQFSRRLGKPASFNNPTTTSSTGIFGLANPTFFSFGIKSPVTTSATTQSSARFSFGQVSTPTNKAIYWSSDGSRFGQAANSTGGFSFGRECTATSSATTQSISIGQAPSATKSTTTKSIGEFIFGPAPPATSSTTTQSSGGLNFGQGFTATSGDTTETPGGSRFGRAPPATTHSSLRFTFQQAPSTTSSSTTQFSGGFKLGQGITATSSPTCQSPQRFFFGLGPLATSSLTTQSSGGFGFGRGPVATSSATTQLISFGDAHSITTTNSSGGFSFGLTPSAFSSVTTQSSGGTSFGHSPATSSATTQPSGGFNIRQGPIATSSATNQSISFGQSAHDLQFGQGPLATSSPSTQTSGGFTFGQGPTETSSATTQLTSFEQLAQGFKFGQGPAATSSVTTLSISSGQAPSATSSSTTQSSSGRLGQGPIATSSGTTQMTSLGHAPSTATTNSSGGSSIIHTPSGNAPSVVSSDTTQES